MQQTPALPHHIHTDLCAESNSPTPSKPYNLWDGRGGRSLDVYGHHLRPMLSFIWGLPFPSPSFSCKNRECHLFYRAVGKFNEAMYEKYLPHSKYLRNGRNSHFYQDHFVLQELLLSFVFLSQRLSRSGPISNLEQIHFLNHVLQNTSSRILFVKRVL